MSDERKRMAEWLVAIISNIKIVYKDEGISYWSKEDEAMFQKVLQSIQQGPWIGDIKKYAHEKALSIYELGYRKHFRIEDIDNIIIQVIDEVKGTNA